jgi:hypothetical protein
MNHGAGRDMYEHDLEILAALAEAGSSFDIMSMNLDIVKLDPLKERAKWAVFGSSCINGIECGQMPLLGQRVVWPIVLAHKASRDLALWHLMQNTDIPDVVVEYGCGAGQNVVTLARAFPKTTFYATDLSPTALKCVQVLAKAAGISNVVTNTLDLLQPDFSFLGDATGYLIFGYSVLAGLPDAGRAFLEHLKSAKWDQICLFEPIGGQHPDAKLISAEQSAKMGLSQGTWLQIEEFLNSTPGHKVVIPDFCGQSPLYPHTLIHLKSRSLHESRR